MSKGARLVPEVAARIDNAEQVEAQFGLEPLPEPKDDQPGQVSRETR